MAMSTWHILKWLHYFDTVSYVQLDNRTFMSEKLVLIESIRNQSDLSNHTAQLLNRFHYWGIENTCTLNFIESVGISYQLWELWTVFEDS